MNRFAALMERLDGAKDEDSAARALAAWLAETPDPDRGVALGLLIGDLSTARATPAAMKALGARLDPVLLAISKETTGDLAEAIALMWPGPARQPGDAPGLVEVASLLADRRQGPATLAERLAGLLDVLEPSARAVLMRLSRGGLAGLVPARVAQAALALLSVGAIENALAEVEAIWHALEPPYEAAFAWVSGAGPMPPPAPLAAFAPLARVRLWSPGDREALPIEDVVADHAWDGLRALAAFEGGVRRLYSRRGVDVGGAYPEILDALAAAGAGSAMLEGVVVARGPDGRISRAALDARLADRRAATGSTFAFIAHDALAISGDDLRALPLHARRERLDALLRHLPPQGPLSLAPLSPATSWEILETMRRDARAHGAAGLVLKRADAAYAQEGADWVEMRCDPHTALCVLLYVEYGPQGAVATVGAWDGDRLAPLGKALVENDRDALRIADYARESRADRFGPVVQVQADELAALVIEIAFDRVERAPRRKSGVALAGVRILRVRADAAPTDAARLDDVRRLLA